MTVRELIKKLTDFDPRLEVKVGSCGEGTRSDIHRVTVSITSIGNPLFDGEFVILEAD